MVPRRSRGHACALQPGRDLTTRWDVTPLTPGRWLVQAKDLTPWLVNIDEAKAVWSHEYPDPDLLDQARHDFGDMVLTEGIAAARSVRR